MGEEGEIKEGFKDSYFAVISIHTEPQDTWNITLTE